MSKFLTGKELEDAIYNIIWEARDTLFIVSPFVRLDEYFKKLFKKHIDNDKLRLIVVFGKNEKEVNKSLSKNDLDFFKSFRNVSIVYVPNLHGKYYGNEKQGMITSINLYDYSFKNNIEFGIFSEHTLMNKIFKSADDEAWDKCMEIAKTHDVVFIKRPAYKSVLMGLSSEYVKSEVLFDSTDSIYGLNGKPSEKKRLDDFPEEVKLSSNASTRPTREEVENETQSQIHSQMGYCIRTGVKIPFNPERPFCYEAFKSWSQFENENYPEKYCHYSGEPSNGETSYSKPILKKNWSKAKAIFSL